MEVSLRRHTSTMRKDDSTKSAPAIPPVAYRPSVASSRTGRQPSPLAAPAPAPGTSAPTVPGAPAPAPGAPSGWWPISLGCGLRGRSSGSTRMARRCWSVIDRRFFTELVHVFRRVTRRESVLPRAVRSGSHLTEPPDRSFLFRHAGMDQARERARIALAEALALLSGHTSAGVRVNTTADLHASSSWPPTISVWATSFCSTMPNFAKKRSVPANLRPTPSPTEHDKTAVAVLLRPKNGGPSVLAIDSHCSTATAKTQRSSFRV